MITPSNASVDNNSSAIDNIFILALNKSAFTLVFSFFNESILVINISFLESFEKSPSSPFSSTSVSQSKMLFLEQPTSNKKIRILK